MENVTLGLAFIAGLASFVSPCVLPLVPAYIGYMGGRVTQRVAAQVAVGAQGGTVTAAPSLVHRFSTLMHGMAFVLGFTFVFVSLGLLSTAFIEAIGSQNLSLVTRIIGRVGGVIIIFFGLHFMGVLPSLLDRLRAKRSVLDSVLTSVTVAALGSLLLVWAFSPDMEMAVTGSGTDIQWGTGILIALPLVAAWLLLLVLGGALTMPGQFWTKALNTLEAALYSDTRMQMAARGNQGLVGSALTGIVFSAGWTPCIGPIYGAVLTMAANTGNVGQAGPLLAAYSLGLGIPFLLTALLLDGAQGILRRVQRHMHKIELVSGAFLVFVGVMVASGRLQEISQSFRAQFSDLSIRVETCVVGFANGEVYLSHMRLCLDGRLSPARLDEPAQGTLLSDAAQMEFVFLGHAGETVDIEIQPIAGSLTPALALFDPDGKEITRAESNQPMTGADAAVLPVKGLTLSANGLYTIQVTSKDTIPAGETSLFSLTVTGSSEVSARSAAPGDALASLSSIEDLASAAPAIGTAVGNLAPDFSLKLDSGDAIRLSELRGRFVVLNFWATWCGPCRREMPEFERAYRQRAGDGLTILAINNRETLEDVTGFREELGLTFPIALDETGKIQGEYGIVSYPSTYVIDRSGVIIARYFGAMTVDKIAELVDKSLS